MREPFLINPVRRRKTRQTLGKSRRGGLPKGLLSRMVKKYGKDGMSEAWKAHRSGIRTNTWPRHPAEHKRAAGVGGSSRKTGISGFAKPSGIKYPRWENPLGEEVLIVGMNPRRRHKRKRTRLFSKVASPRRYGRVKRSRRRLFANEANPVRRHRRRRHLSASPARRHRRLRRNPAAAAAISIRRPMSLLMPIATGIAAKLATEKIPAMLNITSPLPRAGVQVGVMLAGSLLLGKFIGRTNATIWTVVSGVTIASALLDQYIFKTVAAVAGVGWLQEVPYSGVGAPSQLGAYSEEYQGVSGLGAYPFEEVVSY